MTNKNDNGEPIRRISRVRLMENARQVYSCECGKTYLTFSALYLHVKIKHEERLSTKKSEQNHQVDQDGNKMVKTYFLKQAQLPTPIQTQNSILYCKNKSQYFKEILGKYRQDLRLTCPNLELRQNGFLVMFESYIDEIAKQLDRDTELPMDLTFYFNQFTVYYLPKHHQLQGVESIDAVRKYGQNLVAFWQWLKLQRMTNAELKLNDLYSAIPFSSNSRS